MTTAKIKYLCFDWGDTLMADHPQYTGAMHAWPQITPMDGVLPLMPELSKSYKCVVLSNAAESDAQLMKKAFERAGIDQHFHCFYTSKELGAAKPDLMFFRQALQLLGAKACEAIMIGNDYRKDIVPAKEVGMHTVLISRTPGNYPCADYAIENFYALSFLF